MLVHFTLLRWVYKVIETQPIKKDYLVYVLKWFPLIYKANQLGYLFILSSSCFVYVLCFYDEKLIPYF